MVKGFWALVKGLSCRGFGIQVLEGCLAKAAEDLALTTTPKVILIQPSEAVGPVGCRRSEGCPAPVLMVLQIAGVCAILKFKRKTNEKALQSAAAENACECRNS